MSYIADAAPCDLARAVIGVGARAGSAYVIYKLCFGQVFRTPEPEGCHSCQSDMAR